MLLVSQVNLGDFLVFEAELHDLSMAMEFAVEHIAGITLVTE